ncbi:hypothetical protein [Actinomadura sp. 9N407]|uniref:hypothetical protein n=1 Tax=Actinomadura sp. 9N407 TaxID=3375154 RepID=UPI003794E143
MKPNALIRPAARTLPWKALAGAGGLGLALIAAPAAVGGNGDVGTLLTLLRIAALAGALGAAFVLEDPARDITDVVPVQRPVRQALRVALVLPVVAVWWAAVLGLGYAGSGGKALPWAEVTLEAAGLFALTLGLAGAAVRFSGATAPGAAVGGAVLAIFVVAAVVPPRFALFVPPEHERFDDTHLIWAAVLVLALLAWAACAREPAGRRGKKITIAGRAL